MSELVLTIKKKWFDMIASGEKKEDYRELKPYWFKRLKLQVGYRDFESVLFRNGYRKDSPKIRVEFLGTHQGRAKAEWSGGATGCFYVIKLGKLLKGR